MKEHKGVINLSYPEKPYVIYTMISSDINDNTIYIGTTTDFILRASKHSSGRFAKNYKNKPLYIWMADVIDNKKLKILFKVIETDYNEKDAFIREQEVIQDYKDKRYNVINMSNGGRGANGITPWNKGKKMSEDIKKKYSESHMGIVGGMKGKNHSEETKKLISLKNQERKEKNWINPRKKKVYKYTLDGELLKVYTGLIEAGKAENVSNTTIGDWCINQRISKNDNIMWSYKDLTL